MHKGKALDRLSRFHFSGHSFPDCKIRRGMKINSEQRKIYLWKMVLIYDIIIS